MKDEHKQPPKTMAEIGIHIGYIYEKLAELTVLMKEAPSRPEFNALEADHIELKKSHKNYVDKADKTFVTKKEVNAGYVVITVILAVAISVWTLVDKIKGV